MNGKGRAEEGAQERTQPLTASSISTRLGSSPSFSRKSMNAFRRGLPCSGSSGKAGLHPVAERQRERERMRERGNESMTERENDRMAETETERQTDRQRQRDKGRDRMTGTERRRDRETETEWQDDSHTKYHVLT